MHSCLVHVYTLAVVSMQKIVPTYNKALHGYTLIHNLRTMQVLNLFMDRIIVPLIGQRRVMTDPYPTVERNKPGTIYHIV